jgi:putative nucleotidyltransferase with HDIG domain
MYLTPPQFSTQYAYPRATGGEGEKHVMDSNKKSILWQALWPFLWFNQWGKVTTMADIFKSIIEGSERLSNLADIDAVVKDLSRLLKKMVRSRWTAAYFFDRDRRDFTPVHSAGLPARYQPFFHTMPLASDNLPIIKGLLRKKQHLLITDTGSSPLLNPRFRRMLRDVNLLAVPMIARSQVLGAVFVSRARKLPPFSPDEIAIIRDMVAHAALVVSHMRLFDETLDMSIDLAGRIDVIMTLDEINKAISSSLSREKIMETAMQHIERITRSELVAVLQVEEEDLVITAIHGNGITVPPKLLAGTRLKGRSTASAAFTRQTSQRISDLATQERLNPLDRSLLQAGIRSLFAIPLLAKDRINGVLLLGDTDAGQFAPEATFTIEKIASQMAVALANARLYEDLHILFISTVTSLANAIDAKSPWTKGHSVRVMQMATHLAREMGLSDEMVERVRLGGLLHDIGKIGIIEALLEKPAALMEDEFPPMRLHPEKGVAILAPIEQLREVLPGILHHHERYDGSGYPHKLKGEAIPLEARIIGVVDAFDAMVAERPYKPGYSATEALSELRRWAGTQFDPVVVDHFTRYMTRAMGKTDRLKAAI